jgi:uncharacterized protein YndB with AHSA1/START domain
MPTFSATQNFTAEAPQVFDFLADARNMTHWNSGVAEVDDRRIDPCEGARYRYRFPGRHRYHHLVCSEYRAPSVLRFRGDRMWTPLGTQSVAYTFRVLPSGEGTTLRMTVEVTVHGGMLLLVPIIALGWRRDLPEDLEKLRETVDPAAPAPVPADEAVPGTAEPRGTVVRTPGASPAPEPVLLDRPALRAPAPAPVLGAAGSVREAGGGTEGLVPGASAA